ncbi:cyclase family protein [Nocardia sp. NPDC057668]|uniref:cyclase family protein n=1 Tax=Nocardia sp. NPDC057668 TaxID=3346202 RepID=UPI00366E5E35
MRLIDMSVPLRSGMPVYPGDPEVVIEAALTVAGAGVNVLGVHMGSQSGTHVDAPRHIDDGLPALDEVPLERFAGAAVVIDAREFGARAAIGAEVFEGRVAAGQIVLICTGWSRFWGTDEYLAHPFLSVRAARYLVDAGIRTVGIDALSVDPTPAHDIPAPLALCRAHAVIAENLTNLAEVLAAQEAGDTVEASLFPLHIPGADGAPVRAVARIHPAARVRA